MRERTTKILSLLFSVYSPLYLASVILIKINRSPKYGVGVGLSLLLIDALFGQTTGYIVIGIFLLYITLYTLWIWLIQKNTRLGSLYAYPIHPWLYRRVDYLCGYHPMGHELYEIHIDPKLLKRVPDTIQAGVMVLHDAKHFTAELKQKKESTSVVGTTYEGKLAKVATSGARKNIKSIVHKQGVCPPGSKLLYPQKEWDTFIWEI